MRVLSPAGLLRAGTGDGASDSWRLITSEGLAPVLPRGQAPQPLVSARATLKWDLLTWVAAVGELSYTWERHTFVPHQNPWGQAAVTYDELWAYHTRNPTQDGLGFNLLVQARY